MLCELIYRNVISVVVLVFLFDMTCFINCVHSVDPSLMNAITITMNFTEVPLTGITVYHHHIMHLNVLKICAGL